MYDINQTLKALTWREPFGSLMLYGKTLETRSWKSAETNVLRMICCGRNPYSKNEVREISGERHYKRIWEILEKIFPEHEDRMKFPPNNLGMAIAIGTLTSTRLMEPRDETLAFVSYWPTIHIHEYTDIIPIIPFHWVGKQGLKGVDYETKLRIKDLHGNNLFNA